MQRVRVGIVGAGALTEGAILPALSGPDSMAPPDNGSWWHRRPSGHADIEYQGGAWPEVVALADAREERVQRVGQASRVRALYTDWRAMLRETPLDALICALPPEECTKVLWDVHARALKSPMWVWLPGPPASTAAATFDLAASTMALRVWCARPWRQASAHRAARRLIERGEIDRVTALSLRWPASFPRGESFEPGRSARHSGNSDRGNRDTNSPAMSKADGAILSSCYSALDLILSFAALSSDRAASGTRPSRIQAVTNSVAAREFQGATSVLLGFDSGATATALFSSAEDWNAPWPRLEVCGSHGKSIVCEGGRAMHLFEPREPTRVLSPPSTPTVSTANVLGVAEDLKGFFAAWSESRTATRPAPLYFPDLLSAARVLEVLESIAEVTHADVATAIYPAKSLESGADADAASNHQREQRHSSSQAATESAAHNSNGILPLYD